jgi:hypothetical protein
LKNLTKKATGLATGILGDIKGTNDDGSASANLQNMFQNADNRDMVIQILVLPW